MLILICPVCESTMQVLAKTDKGEPGYKCHNEMCPSYYEVVPLKEITEKCIKYRQDK